jgi:hypothetical protein
MNNKLQTITNLFEEKEIRSFWDSEKEEYYFSVIDVIGALTWDDIDLEKGIINIEHNVYDKPKDDKGR